MVSVTGLILVFGTWVGCIVGGGKSRSGDVSVDLSCRERGVAEEFLYGAEVCASIKEVCGEAMANLVWGDVKGDFGKTEVFIE